MNARAQGFYTDTRATIDLAWIRPREPWWPYFQRHAGEAIRRGVVGASPAAPIVAELTAIWETALTAAAPASQWPRES